MFYLYVKIYSRGQLMQMEPVIMEGLADRITGINRNQGGNPVPGMDGIFRYAALYRETLNNIMEAAGSCLDVLELNKDSLDGYNIIITKSEKKNYELQKSLDFLVFQILEDGGIWIDPECREELDSFLSMEKESCLYRMEGRKKLDLTSRERLTVLWDDEAKQKDIANWLEDDSRPVLLITGRHGNGRKSNLDAAMERYYGGEKNSAVHLRLRGSKDYIYDPFMDCLFKDEMAADGMEPDHFLLELLEGKMMSRCSDFFSDDFERAFLGFLEKKYRKARERSRSLFVIVEQGKSFSPMSRRLLEKILSDGRYRTILISEGEKPPFLRDTMIYEEISFQKPGKLILEQRLKKAYPSMEWPEETLQLLMGDSGVDLRSVFFNSWLLFHGLPMTAEKNALDQMVDALSSRELRILHYIHLAQGLVGKEELARFLADEQEDSSLVFERIERLKALTLIDETEKGELYSNLPTWNRDRENHSAVVKGLIGLLKGRGDLNPFRYFDFLEEHGEIGKALEYFNNIMNWLINNGFREKADRRIQTPPFAGKDLEEEYLEALQNILFSSRLRLAMLEGEESALDNLVANGILSQVSERRQFAGEFYLQLARYYYCQGNTEQTINAAKNSLFRFQKTGYHLGESLANIELAFAFLGQRKVQMGMDYFEIARRISYQIEDNYSLITAHTFGALTAYLFGNMSKAEDIIAQTLELAGQNGSRRRFFFLTFLSGRIQFEYGHYREGAELFEECYHLGKQIGMDEGARTAARWVGRCLIYDDKRRDAFRWLDSEDKTREGLFFLAEADFMVSLYEAALRKLESAGALPAETSFGYSEKDVWYDGYMSIEGRLSSSEVTEDVLTGQIDALHGHVLALAGRQDEAKQLFSRKGAQDDYPFKPYSYKYSYIHFSILNVGDVSLTGDDKRLAALSRAIERLQSRAGRFDNQRKKLDFLNKNWWNKKIIEEAHRKKFL